MTKKNIVAGIALVSMLPVTAFAASTDELQAQINALMAQLSAAKPATTASCVASFTKTLKQGMTDAEVMNLQKVLNSDVATQIAAAGIGSKGNETKYFGAATKAAVIKFQEKYAAETLTPAGLSKGTGMVGAATRAKLNASCGTTSTTTTTPSTTVSTDLKGGAGTFTINKYTSDVEDNVVTGNSKTVLSFKGSADGSDISVKNIKITVLKNSGAGSSYLNRYFTSFDVMADGKKVGSVDVADFTRNGSGDYSKTISLDGAIIKSGSSNKVVFAVKANAVASIDSADEGSAKTWNIKASDMRYTDATGVILSSTETTSDTSFYVEKLATSGDVKVKVSSASTNPEEKTVFVSDDNSGDKVTMNEFKIKAEGTDVKFDTLSIKVTAAGYSTIPSNMVSEFQLVKGDSVLETVEASSTNGVVKFNLDDQQTIKKDETSTFKIVAKMQKIGTAGNFRIGDKLTVSFDSINPEDKNGDAITGSSKVTGSADGKIQTFRATGINLAKVSSSASTVAHDGTTNGYGKFSFDVKVTASGDDLWIPLTSATTSEVGASSKGIVYELPAGATTAVVTRVSGGSTDGTYAKIADGETATLRINVSYDPANSGFAKMTVKSLNYTLNKTDYSAIEATPTSDFETDSVDVRK